MSTITEILGTDNPAATRSTINDNFNALNLDKVEKVGTDSVSITIADGANQVGLTINQNDVTNTPPGLKVVTAASGDTPGKEAVTIESTFAGQSGPAIEMYHNSTSPASGDYGGFYGYFNNSIGEKINAAGFNYILETTTDGSETAYMYIKNMLNGVYSTRLEIGNGINGITVGTSTAAGVVESSGNQDLILQTGNATTGTITIVDGANGLISITPNGTGAVRIGGTLELGHATDTTLSRVSAGVIAVEGVNLVKENSNASAAEVNTGTSTTKFVTPDSLAGSNLGIRYAQCPLNGTTALTTADKCFFRIPAAFNGMNLVSVTATVGTGSTGSSSSGIPTFTVKKNGSPMLSTNLTVDATEYTSTTAVTAAVINTTADDVATDNLIAVECTVAGTGVTYAQVVLGFQLP